jgi:hypothetical protein
MSSYSIEHHHMSCVWAGHGTPEETQRLWHDGAIELGISGLSELGHEIIMRPGFTL